MLRPISMWFKNFSLSFLALLTLSCSSIPQDERENTRQEITLLTESNMQKLIKNNPEAMKTSNESVGYFAGNLSAAQVAVLGAGKGIGLLKEKSTGTTTFMDIKRFDIGLGLSATNYWAIIFFQTQDALDEFKRTKKLTALSAENSIGTLGSANVNINDSNSKIFFLNEKGAALTLTASLLSVSVNTELTDTGLSDVSIPMTNFNKNTTPSSRKWDRKLPFLAQQVIDQGYDLPLPYGFGLTYANIEQSMILQDLAVGINGKDEEPFEFVSFENSVATNNTLQLKFDTWLFPFMNVFALLGKIEGTADLDIWLDGNGMLEHMDTSCEGIIKPPTCKLLADKQILLPIETHFSGKSYGVGTVLAGGWNDWFVSIPISLVYADMDNTNTEGLAFTFTPRFGYLVNIPNKGNLALYVGGNYLETDLTISGSVGIDELVTIDYTLDQENTDEWNTVIGTNWDVNKKWSIHLEYNGFNGSRDSWISSVTFRF